MSRRTVSTLSSAVFLLAAPGTVAGLIPWWISGWRLPVLDGRFVIIQIAGVLLMAAGTGVLLDSFVRFAWTGLGSPAPIMPTKQLVVGGLYRWVRNPMYVAVVLLILGQAMVFARLALAVYAGFVWVCFHVFVRVYEEPTLCKSFGAEYEAFCSDVPRWIPKLTSGIR